MMTKQEARASSVEGAVYIPTCDRISQYSVKQYIEVFHPYVPMFLGFGEHQIAICCRIDSSKKDYTKGQPDFMLSIRMAMTSMLLPLN